MVAPVNSNRRHGTFPIIFRNLITSFGHGGRHDLSEHRAEVGDVGDGTGTSTGGAVGRNGVCAEYAERPRAEVPDG